jgi:hypothetical protein
MDHTATITGGGYNLTISASSASTLGNINNVNLLTLESGAFTSNSLSTFQVSTVQTNYPSTLSRNVTDGSGNQEIFSDSNEPGGLQYMQYNLSGNYILENNINAADTSSWSWIGGSVDFLPIGSASTPFTGSFNGKGLTISNLTIYTNPIIDASYGVGFFGYTSSTAVLSNIQLINVNVDVTEGAHVGGLVGLNGGSITDAFTTGSVYGGYGYVGGLVGENLGTGTISNSYSTVSVTNGSSYTGGLVGKNDYEISNSYSTGSVNGYGYAGGLVGWNNSGSIINSYSTGNVSGSQDVGGLVGWNSSGSSITNSYSNNGSVSGSSTDVGGLAGENEGSIINSFATGNVSGTTYFGGFVGWNGGTLTNDAWWTGATGPGYAVGYDSSTLTHETLSHYGGTDEGTLSKFYTKTLEAVYNGTPAWSTATWSFSGSGLPLLTQTPYVWTGATSNTWSTASNWASGIAPPTGANIIIEAGSNNPVLTSGITSSDILVNFGAVLDPSIYTITGTNLDVFGTVKVGDSTFGGNYVFSGTKTLETGSTVNYYSTGAQSVDNTLSYYNLVTSGSGDKTFNGYFPNPVRGDLTVGSGTDLNGGQNVSVTGNAYIYGTVGGDSNPLVSLYVSGTTQISGGSVTTSGGPQIYVGNVTLGAGGATLTGSVTFDGLLNSFSTTPYSMSITGAAFFDGAVGGIYPLNNLSVSSTSAINGGSVATSGAQTYNGPVTLGTNTVLTGDNITFASTLNGAYNLIINDSGTTTFDNAVGGITPLVSLDVTAANIVIDSSNGSINTTGPVTIDVLSNLNLNGPITTTYGNVLLEAANGSIQRNIYVNEPIMTSGGNVLLEATGSIYSTNGASLATGGGTFTAVADSDRNGYGVLNFAPGGYYGSSINTTIGGIGATGGLVDLVGSFVSISGPINAGNGNVYIAPSVSGETIGLGSGSGTFKVTTDMVSYINTTGTVVIGYSPFFGTTAGNIKAASFFTSNVYLELDTLGSITGAGSISPDITVNSLTMNAGTGIGSVSHYLQTLITNLTTTNSTSGNIYIDNTGSLNAISVANSAPNAWIYLSTLGTASDIDVYYISGVNVNLNATGSIIGENLHNLSPVDIDAANLYLNANLSIKGNYTRSLHFSGSTGFLTTDATYIDATAVNDIQIGATGNVELHNIVSTTSYVYAISLGNIIVNSISASTSGKSVTLESERSIIGAKTTASSTEIDTPNLYLCAGDYSIYGLYTPRTVFDHVTPPNEYLTTNAGNITASAEAEIDIYGSNAASTELVDVEAANVNVVTAYDNIVKKVAGTNVTLESQNGNIIGQNFTSPDISAGHLYLSAADSIYGLYGPSPIHFSNNGGLGFLTTNAFYITSYAGASNTNIFDVNSTHLEDVEGDNINIIVNSGDLTADIVKGTNTNGTASVSLQTNDGDIVISGGDVEATVTGPGTSESATVYLNASDGITVESSSNVGTFVAGDGSSAVIFIANVGGITITTGSGSIGAVVVGTNSSDSANISMTAYNGGSITIINTPVIIALVHDGTATISLDTDISPVGGFISITDSDITASVMDVSGTGGSALVTIDAHGSVSITGNSDVMASIAGDGASAITITADVEDISITVNTTIEATVAGGGTSTITITADAGGITINASNILAEVLDGSASINLTATEGAIGITDSNVTALVMDVRGTGGSASVTIDAHGSVSITGNSDITASVAGTGTSTIAITAATGDITIGASTILAEVLDGSASINLTATDGAIGITGSNVTASVTDVGGTGGSASVTIDAGTSVTIDNPSHSILANVDGSGTSAIHITADGGITTTTTSGNIKATVAGDGSSTITLTAHDGDITITSGDIEATVAGDGTSDITITADAGDIVISSGDIEATVGGTNHSDSATVSMITHGGDITIDFPSISSFVLAKVLDGTATISLNAVGHIGIENSILISKVEDSGEANITFTASDGIGVSDDSLLLAKVDNYGKAKISLNATGDDIRIANSKLISKIGKSGKANIAIDAEDGSISTWRSKLEAEITDNGKATIWLNAGQRIHIAESKLEADIGENGRAHIAMNAGTSISIWRGTLEAEVTDNGSARVWLNAGHDLRIDEAKLKAEVKDGSATISLNATDAISVNDANITALVTDVGGTGGSASISMTAGTSVTIDNTNPNTDYIKSTISGDGTSTITITANNGSIGISNGDIEATVGGPDNSDSANIYMTAYDGIGNSITIDDSTITARVQDGSALIRLDTDLSTVGDAISITDSNITASVTDASATGESASITIDAATSVTIDNTGLYSILANVDGSGNSTITITANAGDITTTATSGNIEATVAGDGSSIITLTASGNITIINGNIEATVGGISGSSNSASITMTATDGLISITESSNIIASVTDSTLTGESASISMTAGTSVTVDDGITSVEAEVAGDGISTVTITANHGAINITNRTTIEATVGGTDPSDRASISMTAYKGGSIIIDTSTITAQVQDGTATISLNTDLSTVGDTISITDSDITASVMDLSGTGGSASITIDAATSVTITNTDPDTNHISSVVVGDGGSTITITANDGSIGINNSDIEATVGGTLSSDSAEISMTADGTSGAIGITNSDITASLTGASTTGASASVTINAATSVTISNTYPYTYYIKSTVAGDGASNISITAGTGDITITNGDIEATVAGNGTSGISITAGTVTAGGNITIDTSFILAKVQDGGATITIHAPKGTVTITNSNLIAKVYSGTTATITIDARNGVAITQSNLIAKVNSGTATITIGVRAGSITISESRLDAQVRHHGEASITIETAIGLINIIESGLTAEVSGGTAEITIGAFASNITISESRLEAQVRYYGEATVLIETAIGGVNIADSHLTAKVHSGTATINIDVRGIITISESRLDAQVRHHGEAMVTIDSRVRTVTITNSDITAEVTDVSGTGGSASIIIDAGTSVTIDDGASVEAEVAGDGTSDISITAYNGAITITNGDIEATVGGTDASDSASISMTADGSGVGSISIIDSDITASLTGATASGASASVIIDAATFVTITNTSAHSIDATVAGDGTSDISITAYDGAITITNGDIEATVGGTDASDSASISMIADGSSVGSISIIDSDITASLTGASTTGASASITIDAATSVTINNTAPDGHSIKAIVAGDGGSTITITANDGSIGISNGDIEATVGGTDASDSASISMIADGSIVGSVSIIDSDITASLTGASTTGASASITIDAATSVTINNTAPDGHSIKATVAGDGGSTITITANDGSIGISNGDIEATVGGTDSSDSASISMTAYNGGDITIGTSTITAQVQDGHATISLDTDVSTLTLGLGAAISITDSDMTASVTDLDGKDELASITIEAGTSVTIHNTNPDTYSIKSTIAGEDTSLVTIAAHSGDITITNGDIEATVDKPIFSDIATVSMTTDEGNITIDTSFILAQVIGGTATINLNVNGHIGVKDSVFISKVEDSGSVNKARIFFTASDGIGVSDDSLLLAKEVDSGRAVIWLNATGGNIWIADSSIKAEVRENDLAFIAIGAATGNITIWRSNLEAKVTDQLGKGINAAIIWLKAGGNVRIAESKLNAEFDKNGLALIVIRATGDIKIWRSNLEAVTNKGKGLYGIAIIWLRAGGDVKIAESKLKAEVGRNGLAGIVINATGDIKIWRSNLEAEVTDEGEAGIQLNAGGNVRIVEAHLTTDVEESGEGVVIIDAMGDITILRSSLEAEVTDGGAVINLTATDGFISITDSDITASVTNVSGTDEAASITIEAGTDVTIDNTAPDGHSIEATVAGDGTSDISITADSGAIDITYGDIEATVGGTDASDRATISMTADGEEGSIDISDSDITASLTNDASAADASASITIDATSVTINNTDPDGHSIEATVAGDGTSDISITADGAIDITYGDIEATVGGTDASDSATISMTADGEEGSISISDSDITASLTNDASAAGASASVTIDATSVTINNTDPDGHSIEATVAGDGTSDISITADNGGIDITNGDIEATVGGTDASDSAEISMTAYDGGNITIGTSTITAQVQDGSATINLDTHVSGDTISITDSDITASVTDVSGADESASVTIDAGTSVTIYNTNPHTYYIKSIVAGEGPSLVTITAHSGDITITNGDIEATVDKPITSDTATVSMTTDEGDITIDNSFILAQVLDGSATIRLNATGHIGIEDSVLISKVEDSGKAHIALTASDGIGVSDDSLLLAKIVNYGKATIWLDATGGDIWIADSKLISKTEEGGEVKIAIDAKDGNIKIWRSKLEAKIADNGRATIWLNAGGDSGNVKIAESKLEAEVGGYGETKISVNATGDIKVWRGKLEAEVAEDGTAEITLQAGSNIKILDSRLDAKTGRIGEATITIGATGNITIWKSSLDAQVRHYGEATITIYAEGDEEGNVNIAKSHLTAEVSSGMAGIMIEATAGNITIWKSSLDAQVRRCSGGSWFGAVIWIMAEGNVTITKSHLTAEIGNGEENSLGAVILVIADGSVTITKSHLTTEVWCNGTSAILIEAADGDITITDADIKATVNGSDESDSATVEMEAKGNITMDSSTILSGGLDSSVDLTSLNGSIIGKNGAEIETETLDLQAFDSIYGDSTVSGLQYPPTNGRGFLTTDAQYITALAGNNIQIYDTGAVTLVSVKVTNLRYYGNVTLEALDGGDITGANDNPPTPDILTGNLYLYASGGTISGNYPTTGGSLTTNASYISAIPSISIFDTLGSGTGNKVTASPASIDIVANGNITADYVSAFKHLPPPVIEPILLGGTTISYLVQKPTGGVSYYYNIESDQPEFNFYHPYGDIDSSAFNNITLDASAYNFVNNELEDFQGPVPRFFGIQ